jgi:hypothetical protein
MFKSKSIAGFLLVTCLLVSCGKDDNGNKNKLNPNPTPISNVQIMKFTLAKDDFNMITEPGFELFTDKGLAEKSNWYYYGISEKDPAITVATNDAHSGTTAVKTTNDVNGQWVDVCYQSIAVKKSKDYVLTCWGKTSWADQNAFAGVRMESGVKDDKAGAVWNADGYNEFTKEFNSGDNVQANVFTGCWGWPGVWVEVDDYRLIPKGTTQTSTKLTAVNNSGNLMNATYVDLSKVGNAVIWKNTDNTYSFAMHNVTAGGKTYDNLYATSDDATLTDGLYVGAISEDSDGNPSPMIVPSGATETSCVPTAGVNFGGKEYVHYYSLKEIDATNDQAWTANFSGLLSSADGGKTWTREAKGRWSGTGHFVQVSFYQGEKYLYMFGSNAGRSTPQVYLARISNGGDMSVAANWAYWDGSDWVTGDPDVAAAITYGNAAEMTVTYEPVQKRYVMIYRSKEMESLVFRDAGSPEGDWSGEKILKEDGTTKLFSPSVVSVSETGEITILASGM